MSETMPDDIRAAAVAVVDRGYDTGLIDAVAAALMAERERWNPAVTYFKRYCQDEASDVDCCLSEQQHEDAKAFAALT